MHKFIYLFLFVFTFISVEGQNQKSQLKDRIKVGLVLSGGGAKGIAHIGVLKVLEEEGIYVDMVGGTSMGGLIGGFYASGYSPEQLREVSNNMPWSKLLSDDPERSDLTIDEKKDKDGYLLSLPLKGFIPGLPKGLIKGQLILNYINKLTWDVANIHDFSKLPLPFYCVATKLENGDTMLLDKGDLPLALRSTMSIPSVFEPVVYNGVSVIDGGLVNNFPVDIMLDKGADFIIGVDVGAPLYKADEISSILDIMDQTSSYHNQSRFKQNKDLTDIYIQPDITGLTAFSFDVPVDSLIKLGEDAARAHIDEIRALAKRIKNRKAEFEAIRAKHRSDTIFVKGVQIVGLHNVSQRMVIGRLDLKLPGVNSVENINLAIDRLYSSGYFQKIDYKLIEDGKDYILDLKLVEKKESLFKVGAFFDTELQAGIRLNLVFRNLLIKGSKMNVGIKMGNNAAGEINYKVDRGNKLGIGTYAKYNSRSILTYNNDYNNVVSDYYTSFSSLSFFGFFNYSNNAELQLGVSTDFFGFSSEVSAIPISGLTATYYKAYLSFDNDSYDNRFFPSKGRRIKIEGDFIKPDIGDELAFYKVYYGRAIPMGEKGTFLPSAFFGGSWNGLTRTGYLYAVGGDNTSEQGNFIPMNGLPYTAKLVNNVVLGHLDFRYELFPKNYIELKTNAGATSNFVEELFVKSDFLYGGGLGYTYKSPIGPIGLLFSASNLRKSVDIYFNIGVNF
jgi:NTE family protein